MKQHISRRKPADGEGDDSSLVMNLLVDGDSATFPAARRQLYSHLRRNRIILVLIAAAVFLTGLISVLF